jgi:hypothetical protein
MTISNPAPIYALNRILAAALRGPNAAVDGILEDYALAREAILSPAEAPRFYLTEEDDPDYPGILDRARPTMVATWGSASFAQDVKDHLAESDDDIMALMWEERKRA